MGGIPSGEEIEVDATRREGAELGLDLICSANIIWVVDVRDHGVLHSWNLRNPSKEVCPGDRIVGVNGIRHMNGILTELRKSGTLILSVCRGIAGSSAVEGPEGSALAPAAGDLSPEARTRENHQARLAYMRAQLFMLTRDVGPEDFERLSALDDDIPKRDVVDQGFIDALPCVSASSCGETECRICLDALEPGDKVLKLACKHAFHRDCLLKWLTEYRGICPLCQQVARIYAPCEGCSGDERRCGVAKESLTGRRQGATIDEGLIPLEQTLEQWEAQHDDLSCSTCCHQ